MRLILERVAAEAATSTSRALEQLSAEAAERTRLTLEKLAAEASVQTGLLLEKLAADETVGQTEALAELSDEIRRLGRELFRVNRAAQHNQELFETAIAELQQLTHRVEQVPAQLHSSESIIEMKSTLCRDLLGVADALEASLAAAQEILAQLRQQVEQVERSASVGEAAPAAPRSFWREKFEQWASKFISPPAPAPPPIERLAAAVAAMSQWHDGQQLIYERLMTVLHTAGVRRIESTGHSFDPARHRAVAIQQRADLPAGTIVSEERKGYMLGGRILRYAEVIVSRHE